MLPSAEGDIVVSAQQSRFHTEANDAPTLKDIDIKDLTVAIGGLEILDHAHLKIQEWRSLPVSWSQRHRQVHLYSER